MEEAEKQSKSFALRLPLGYPRISSRFLRAKSFSFLVGVAMGWTPFCTLFRQNRFPSGCSPASKGINFALETGMNDVTRR
jgi:hypothetical protein